MWVLTAFFRLSDKRDYIAGGFGAIPKPISDEAIERAFFHRLGLKSADLFDRFQRWIEALDDAWRKHEADKARARQREWERERERRGRAAGRRGRNLRPEDEIG